VHALAYPLEGQYKLPHGESNALLLPYVMSYISSSCPEKMRIIYSILEEKNDISIEKSANDIQSLFKKLVGELDLPITLNDYGIPKNQLGRLTEDAIKQTRLLARSPMPLEKEDINKIYQIAFK
jgi:alcohol dehydrogenase